MNPPTPSRPGVAVTGTSVPPADCGATGFVPLAGGVSGAAVWRAVIGPREVVVKRTGVAEPIVLEMLARLADPALPRVLASGRDALGEWLVMPFHSGTPCGLRGALPPTVFAALGRVHAAFSGRRLPAELERLDEGFVVRGLRDFAAARWSEARDLVDGRLHRRAVDLAGQMVADEEFRSLGERVTPTLLHGDAYGLNVLLPGPTDVSPLLIDWGCARVGPAMFDVAMTAGWDSDERRAHDEAWARTAGAGPGEREARLTHSWARSLTQLMFAPVVALRGVPEDTPAMVEEAERAWREFQRLSVRPGR